MVSSTYKLFIIFETFFFKNNFYKIGLLEKIFKALKFFFLTFIIIIFDNYCVKKNKNKNNIIINTYTAFYNLKNIYIYFY